MSIKKVRKNLCAGARSVGFGMAVGFGGSGRAARGVERVQVEAGHLAHHRAVRHGRRHPVHGRSARFAAAGILAANK